jgi:putative ATP-binding cassette transporter
VELGWQTARRLGVAIRNFATSEVGGRAAAFAGLLLAMLLAINGLNVVNSYVGRDFMTAIEHRNRSEFALRALLYGCVFGASTVAAVTLRFCEERLGLLWRNWLTQRLVGFYLSNHLYHSFQGSEGLANTDQRITDDVRSFTTSTLSLVLIFLNGTFTLIAFSGILWSISHSLFAAAVLYAAIGSLLAIWFGRPLVRLNYDQSDREASFRSGLVHVRENAESIAILHREPHLEARLLRQVDALTSNLRRIIAVNRNLGFFTTGYNYLVQLIPAILVAPMFIRGEVEFGVIPQSAMAFAHVVGAFSLIVTQFPMLSSYGAVLARLSAVLDAAEAVAHRPRRHITIAEEEGHLAFEDLTLRTARDARLLVSALSIDVKPGSRLLIKASNEVTASLMRTMVGLRETGEGHVVRPHGDALLVLPERPYLPPGTMRELLVGIHGSSPVTETEILAALRAVTAEDIMGRVGSLDVEHDWSEFLSLEEQRLVEIARSLLLAPRFVVLERLQASIGAAQAAHVLDLLTSRGTGCVVLDDEVTGRELFDVVVEIAPDGTWTQTATAKESA